MKDAPIEPKGDLLTTKEASIYLRISSVTLAKWRGRREVLGASYGPAFVRMGSKVFYRLATLDEFIKSRESNK